MERYKGENPAMKTSTAIWPMIRKLTIYIGMLLLVRLSLARRIIKWALKIFAIRSAKISRKQNNKVRNVWLLRLIQILTTPTTTNNSSSCDQLQIASVASSSHPRLRRPLLLTILVEALLTTLARASKNPRRPRKRIAAWAIDAAILKVQSQTTLADRICMTTY